MITLNLPQRSNEWIIARLWRLTASRLDPIITSAGELSQSKAAIKAIDKLIAGIDLANAIRSNPEVTEMDEWKFKKFMANYTGESFTGNHHTERGTDCEPDAIAALSEIIGSQIQDVGLCVMGDDPNGVVSCSPDGLIYEGGKMIAGAEIKSPCLCGYYGHLAGKVLPDDYKLQVHAGMAICDVDTWHFGSYFTGKPLFHLVVKRDALTDKLQKSLERFRDSYRERYAIVTGELQKLIGKEAA